MATAATSQSGSRAILRVRLRLPLPAVCRLSQRALEYPASKETQFCSLRAIGLRTAVDSRSLAGFHEVSSPFYCGFRCFRNGVESTWRFICSYKDYQGCQHPALTRDVSIVTTLKTLTTTRRNHPKTLVTLVHRAQSCASGSCLLAARPEPLRISTSTLMKP